MQKYYKEQLRLKKFADQIITAIKNTEDGTQFDLNKVRAHHETKFECGWLAFNKRIKLVTTIDNSLTLKDNILTFNKLTTEQETELSSA